MIRTILSLICLLFFVGCEKVDQAATHDPDESETVVLIVIDLSTSFRPIMIKDGVAFEFVMHALHTYCSSRIGSKDRIVIAEISGETKSLLVDGTAQQLIERFPDEAAFTKMLTEARPSGSLCHDGTAHALEYLMMNRNVASGKARSACLVISDMADNGPNPEKSEKRLMDDFIEYTQMGGVIGLYYVDQLLMKKWHRNFKEAGFKMYTVEPDIHGRPALPRMVQ
jgi:hypothetical protein